MSRTELQHEWVKRLAEFKSSGQTATAWCATHEINIHRFRYWSSKLRGNHHRKESNGEIRWLSVEMESPTVNTEAALTVHVGQTKIEVPEGFSPTLLRQVVQALADAR